MNMHKNARLTVDGRERIVPRVESGQTLETVSEAAGVCPTSDHARTVLVHTLPGAPSASTILATLSPFGAFTMVTISVSPIGPIRPGGPLSARRSLLGSALTLKGRRYYDFNQMPDKFAKAS
jgi:hypothetical protein